jgi:3-phenylpropionate/cinnamic acid dioxygenase small subunit
MKPLTVVSVIADPKQRIHAFERLHQELHEFLDEEAALLDQYQLNEWLQLLAQDLRYFMPVRTGTHRADGLGFAARMGHFDDTRASLALRVRRILGTQSAWTEDPPSRVGRFVTGVRTFLTANNDEFAVLSKLLITRSRNDVADVALISADRADLIRRTSEGLRLVQREIHVHQATLGVQNLAIFL